MADKKIIGAVVTISLTIVGVTIGVLLLPELAIAVGILGVGIAAMLISESVKSFMQRMRNPKPEAGECGKHQSEYHYRYEKRQLERTPSGREFGTTIKESRDYGHQARSECQLELPVIDEHAATDDSASSGDKAKSPKLIQC